jgi:hypothetical protein
MSAAGLGTPLDELPRFLMEILVEVEALDGDPLPGAGQARLRDYAARVSSLAEAVWERNPLPGDVKFGLKAVGTSLRILSGEIASDDQDREQEIQDCKQLIIDCGQKTETHIKESYRREALEAEAKAEGRRAKR